MYGPICKQSNLHSRGNIVFLCYLFSVIRGILVHDDTRTILVASTPPFSSSVYIGSVIDRNQIFFIQSKE